MSSYLTRLFRTENLENLVLFFRDFPDLNESAMEQLQAVAEMPDIELWRMRMLRTQYVMKFAFGCDLKEFFSQPLIQSWCILEEIPEYDYRGNPPISMTQPHVTIQSGDHTLNDPITIIHGGLPSRLDLSIQVIDPDNFSGASSITLGVSPNFALKKETGSLNDYIQGSFQKTRPDQTRRISDH